MLYVGLEFEYLTVCKQMIVSLNCLWYIVNIWNSVKTNK